MPAKLSSNPVPSNISVIAVFNPFNPGGVAQLGLVLHGLHSTPETGDPQFTPPQITYATFASYPANSVSIGTVALDVTIGKSGHVKNVRVILSVPSLTSPAISAVRTWRFSAAALQGKPVAAKMIIAFVFQRNVS